MYYTQCINNIWTEQKQAPFSVDKNAGEPFFSADGKRLYFTCWSDDRSSSDIWYVERIADEWGEPQLLPSPVNTDSYDYSYSESADGVGYITSQRSGGVDLWRVRRSPDLTYQAENLGSVVNSPTEDFSSCIAPDGSYLIFASYRSSAYSEQSLWISFNKGNDEWTAPVDMEESGAGINIRNYWQISPSISPDGKYLFFCHHAAARDSIHLYWVSTHIIEGLKEIAFAAQ
jgi:Tol biopolymer transport system component